MACKNNSLGKNTQEKYCTNSWRTQNLWQIVSLPKGFQHSAPINNRLPELRWRSRLYPQGTSAPTKLSLVWSPCSQHDNSSGVSAHSGPLCVKSRRKVPSLALHVAGKQTVPYFCQVCPNTTHKPHKMSPLKALKRPIKHQQLKKLILYLAQKYLNSRSIVSKVQSILYTSCKLKLQQQVEENKHHYFMNLDKKYRYIKMTISSSNLEQMYFYTHTEWLTYIEYLEHNRKIYKN